MAKIKIDGKEHEVDASRNLLDVCLSLGLDLPYFCWHPALGSVGACRQCAVKQYRDANDTHGRLVMACMTPASEGTLISLDDPEARAFRKSVAEWLMVNHPHDCPICDEGGECHLQDMTVMTGQNYREFRFRKRTHRNQDLGPLINHEMNRCIACYRCVRFYDDYAGGRDLQVFAAHDHVYFGRHEDGALQSEFSGNLVEVCPTGVFTDKTLKTHYTRKWDLQVAPSICVHCSLGCNTVPGERYSLLRRVRARYNGQVNGYFLCDRGRYGYEFVNDEKRLRVPLLPGGPDRPAEPLDADGALTRLAELIGDPARLVAIGSPRASLESNFVLRTLAGKDRFFHGIPRREVRLAGAVLESLRSPGVRTPSLREVEEADAVLVLGEDAPNTAPMLALALRQSARQAPMSIPAALKIPDWNDAAVRGAVQQRSGPLYLATPAPTRLDDIATETLRAGPEEIARLGHAVARAIDPGCPSVPGLAAETEALARKIAGSLETAGKPLVVSGTGLGSEAVVRAAAAVAGALARRHGKPADLCLTLSECNSLGLALLPGDGLEGAEEALSSASGATLLILENDLFRRAPRAAVLRLLGKAGRVVVLDQLAHETAARASLLLPAGSFAESDGTFVNNEGRAQRFFQVFVPVGEIRESWRWLADAMRRADRVEASGWDRLDAVLAALAASDPILAKVPEAAPGSGFRAEGSRIPRQTHRATGRTSVLAHRDVSEPKPPDDADTPLSFSMEGFEGQPPSPLTANFWAPGWNSIQSLNRFQIEIGGPLRGGDPGVRLLEPGAPAASAGIPEIASPASRGNGALRAVPIHHVFGSEELSALASGIAALAPKPALVLHPDDAKALGLADGGAARVRAGEVALELPVRLEPGLARGLAGLPAGFAGVEPWSGADDVEIAKGGGA